MKYHRWEKVEGNFRCKRCGVYQRKKYPRVVHCPPTLLELSLLNAARLFYAILYTRIQQGGLSAIDYGNLKFPLSFTQQYETLKRDMR